MRRWLVLPEPGRLEITDRARRPEVARLLVEGDQQHALHLRRNGPDRIHSDPRGVTAGGVPCVECRTGQWPAADVAELNPGCRACPVSRRGRHGVAAVTALLVTQLSATSRPTRQACRQGGRSPAPAATPSPLDSRRQQRQACTTAATAPRKGRSPCAGRMALRGHRPSAGPRTVHDRRRNLPIHLSRRDATNRPQVERYEVPPTR